MGLVPGLIAGLADPDARVRARSAEFLEQLPPGVSSASDAIPALEALLADEDAVRTFARRVRELTAAEMFESARYMPVTCDLSRGRRALLRRAVEGGAEE